ncbi:hypothetical protein ANN_06258 [Periplaneta americana]|uniref:Uncharacterized protein n=1 Tax=Periplaneta americana TaxID=6978 RepID=A0ABQ8TEN4_PERAM|nr:hypothetical protein ANN_06258 [Periplaneta americana]
MEEDEWYRIPASAGGGGGRTVKVTVSKLLDVLSPVYCMQMALYLIQGVAEREYQNHEVSLRRSLLHVPLPSSNRPAHNDITEPPVLLQSGDCTRVMTSFILRYFKPHTGYSVSLGRSLAIITNSRYGEHVGIARARNDYRKPMVALLSVLMCISRHAEGGEVRVDGSTVCTKKMNNCHIVHRTSGHSLLQCDSDFALIEKQQKVTKAFIPSDLLKIVQDSKVVKPFQESYFLKGAVVEEAIASCSDAPIAENIDVCVVLDEAENSQKPDINKAMQCEIGCETLRNVCGESDVSEP